MNSYIIETNKRTYSYKDDNDDFDWHNFIPYIERMAQLCEFDNDFSNGDNVDLKEYFALSTEEKILFDRIPYEEKDDFMQFIYDSRKIQQPTVKTVGL